MEYLPNGFTLELTGGAFPLSTDSMVLAHFARIPGNARVLDLGSGCGTLGLLLCAGNPGCTVTGVELDEEAHLGALANIRRNRLESRMESICGDLRKVTDRFSPGSFSCCVSNPPYFSGGPASRELPLARREDMCTPDQLFQAASRCVKFGGDFFLVHKPERLAELAAVGSRHSFECKRLGLVRHRPDASVSLILLQFRKGAKPGLVWDDIILRNADGTYTDQYKEIYHISAPQGGLPSGRRQH